VQIGHTPAGKAMRFEDFGSYAEIDATYDANTAYLDEKGIDAQDSFIDEYANDVRDPDDPTLQANIYVLLTCQHLRAAKMTHPGFWACIFDLIGVKPLSPLPLMAVYMGKRSACVGRWRFCRARRRAA
jgi:hypothetical protein